MTTASERRGAWQDGNDSGLRAVDLFVDEIKAGTLVASEIADLSGVALSTDQLERDELAEIFENAFLEAVDGHVLRLRPSGNGDWYSGYSNLQGE